MRLVTGDTAIVPAGGGTHSDRSTRLAGTLLVEASGNILLQGKKTFAALAGCAESEVAVEDGFFVSPRSNLRHDIYDIARAIDGGELAGELRKPLASEASFSGRIPA